MAYLTASDVRKVTFKRASFGSRGYDEEEVDTFLDEVEKTIDALTREVAALRGGGEPEPEAVVADLGQHRLMGELDQIKQRLARIEAKVDTRGPAH